MPAMPDVPEPADRWAAYSDLAPTVAAGWRLVAPKKLLAAQPRS